MQWSDQMLAVEVGSSQWGLRFVFQQIYGKDFYKTWLYLSKPEMYTYIIGSSWIHSSIGSQSYSKWVLWLLIT